MTFPSSFTHLVPDSLWLSEKIGLWAIVRKEEVFDSVNL